MDEKGQPITDSLIVAKAFDRRHADVLNSVKALDCSKDFRERNFSFSSYKPEGATRSYDKVIMTFDGYTFLVGGFTGSRAAEFKEKYIAAFNEMREKLSAPAAPKSQLEVLVGVANGLLEQDKKLKELEGKVVRADEQTKALEEKVTEIDHVFHTNGCAKGFIPLKDARGICADGFGNTGGVTRGGYTVIPLR